MPTLANGSTTSVRKPAVCWIESRRLSAVSRCQHYSPAHQTTRRQTRDYSHREGRSSAGGKWHTAPGRREKGGIDAHNLLCQVRSIGDRRRTRLGVGANRRQGKYPCPAFLWRTSRQDGTYCDWTAEVGKTFNDRRAGSRRRAHPWSGRYVLEVTYFEAKPGGSGMRSLIAPAILHHSRSCGGKGSAARQTLVLKGLVWW